MRSRALGLSHCAEGPRANHGELFAKQVATYVQRHLAALADEADGSPGLRRAHGRNAGGSNSGAVERKVHPFAAGQVLQCLFRIIGMNGHLGAELLR